MGKTARAIIVSEDGLYTLYREKVVNGVRHKYYAIPGGHLEQGETLEETVVRELKEELGIDIEVIRFLGKMNEGDSENYYYECRKVNGEPILGGEELERNSKDNYYEFRYLELNKLKDSDIRAIDFVEMVIRDGRYFNK